MRALILCVEFVTLCLLGALSPLSVLLASTAPIVMGPEARFMLLPTAFLPAGVSAHPCVLHRAGCASRGGSSCRYILLIHLHDPTLLRTPPRLHSLS